MILDPAGVPDVTMADDGSKVRAEGGSGGSGENELEDSSPLSSPLPDLPSSPLPDLPSSPPRVRRSGTHQHQQPNSCEVLYFISLL